MIAKVEPIVTARALRGPFDYRLNGHQEGVGVGSVLVVPFGRRRLLGVVVEVAERSDLPAGRLLEPLGVVEGGIPPELVRLGLWMAEQYCSTPARGLALVLPPGSGTGNRRVRPRRSLAAALTGEGRRALATGDRSVGERQRAALGALVDGPRAVATLARGARCDHSTLRRLERRGLVAIERAVEPARRPRLSKVGAPAAATTPTAAQRAALDEVVALLDGRPGGRRLLLHGVTGSGKTEVYLRSAAEALRRGRSAIVLVPEIALTPQTAARFVERFGDSVAVLHSGLSVRERYDEWARLRAGEARVCVGPRSAVFAPLERLGLVVVDEEHDSSYKQEGDPRYDARWVAERRAADAGAVLLAGSATPRPESFLRYRRLELPARLDDRPLPPVELVGTLRTGPLHARTREALEEVCRRGEKAIVLLNRRGWSNFLSCRVCGRVWECRECDVTLVLHNAAGRLACHHCGYREAVPTACPGCGSVSVARHGAGTEQLERELRTVVAPLPVFRLDSDAAGGPGGTSQVLERFDAARSAVLVGTQMVAKGHDFPEVTLGVVVDADATLRFPDFRAEERTFALVAQLAGRSGRGHRGGRVIVQALDPEARALRYAAAHDAQGFLRDELRRREALGYPPFGHLVRVVCSAPRPGPEMAAAEAVRARIEEPGTRVLGPAPLFRRRGRERAQLVVKAPAPGGATSGPSRESAIAAVRRAVAEVAAERGLGGASFAVDVDPQ